MHDAKVQSTTHITVIMPMTKTLPEKNAESHAYA